MRGHPEVTPETFAALTHLAGALVTTGLILIAALPKGRGA
jgi:hypothetical protein